MRSGSAARYVLNVATGLDTDFRTDAGCVCGLNKSNTAPCRLRASHRTRSGRPQKGCSSHMTGWRVTNFCQPQAQHRLWPRSTSSLRRHGPRPSPSRPVRHHAPVHAIARSRRGSRRGPGPCPPRDTPHRVPRTSGTVGN